MCAARDPLGVQNHNLENSAMNDNVPSSQLPTLLGSQLAIFSLGKEKSSIHFF